VTVSPVLYFGKKLNGYMYMLTPLTMIQTVHIVAMVNMMRENEHNMLLEANGLEIIKNCSMLIRAMMVTEIKNMLKPRKRVKFDIRQSLMLSLSKRKS